MKIPEENEIYSLFRVRLTNPERNAFSDDSWDKMEQLLDKQPAKKKAVIWLYRASTGIAAALLLFAIFYFLIPVTPALDKIAKSTNHNLLKSTADREMNIVRKKLEIPVVHQTKGLHPALFTLLTKQHPKEDEHGLILPQVKAITRNVPLIDSVSPAGLNWAVLNLKEIFADSTSSLSAKTLPATDSIKDITSAMHGEKTTKTAHGFSRQLTLSVLAAPDINNANKISNGGQMGTNLGLQLSIQLSRRISLSSGAFYATKPYQTSSANYKPQTPNWWANKFGGTGKPDQVAANCKVLDIPLNVNYLLLSRGGNKLIIGSGLSSYFMLSEAYHFNFADPSVNSTDFEIKNRNQHFFGLINVNATYERKINSRFGILVQPYLKLPITQIGFGQVNLRSTGVAVGLSWNINFTKTQ
jgi:hypothetical protein